MTCLDEYDVSDALSVSRVAFVDSLYVRDERSLQPYRTFLE